VIKTTVRNGRIIVDEPTSWLDGHAVELCVLDGDAMREGERHRLSAGREVGFDTSMASWRSSTPSVMRLD
jgi:hypothetical protein